MRCLGVKVAKIAHFLANWQAIQNCLHIQKSGSCQFGGKIWWVYTFSNLEKGRFSPISSFDWARKLKSGMWTKKRLSWAIEVTFWGIWLFSLIAPFAVQDIVVWLFFLLTRMCLKGEGRGCHFVKTLSFWCDISNITISIFDFKTRNERWLWMIFHFRLK